MYSGVRTYVRYLRTCGTYVVRRYRMYYNITLLQTTAREYVLEYSVEVAALKKFNNCASQVPVSEASAALKMRAHVRTVL